MAIQHKFRTGAEFKHSRNDGRQVWVSGERITDISSHPATRGVVDALAEWYDLHHDPAWTDTLLDTQGKPIGLTIPKSGDDLWALAESIRAFAVRNAGQITHTPVLAHLLLLAVRDSVHAGGNKDCITAIDAYRDRMAREGLLATGPFPGPQTDRFRPPPERLTPKVVKETAGGIVVSGTLGLGTALCYADDILVMPLSPPITTPERAVWFSCPANAAGVKILGRKPSIVTEDRFSYPLSARFDELDCAVVFDNTFIPWENVFAYRDPEFCNAYMFRSFPLGVFYHLARKLGHAEFLVGLAIAVAHMQGVKDLPGVQDDISTLIVQMETLRTALRAACADARPQVTETAVPDQMHIITGSIFALNNRARMAETVRNLAGYGCMLSPALNDLLDPDFGPAIVPNYEGGGYTARERAALLHLLNDATASALEGREAAFTAFSTGGLHIWKLRAGLEWHKHNTLARTVLALLDDWQDKQVDYTPPNPFAPPPGPFGGDRHEREQG
jgi:aromatic ring hydroxylase